MFDVDLVALDVVPDDVISCKGRRYGVHQEIMIFRFGN